LDPPRLSALHTGTDHLHLRCETTGLNRWVPKLQLGLVLLALLLLALLSCCEPLLVQLLEHRCVHMGNRWVPKLDPPHLSALHMGTDHLHLRCETTCLNRWVPKLQLGLVLSAETLLVQLLEHRCVHMGNRWVPKLDPPHSSGLHMGTDLLHLRCETTCLNRWVPKLQLGLVLLALLPLLVQLLEHQCVHMGNRWVPKLDPPHSPGLHMGTDLLQVPKLQLGLLLEHRCVHMGSRWVPKLDPPHFPGLHMGMRHL